MKLTNHARRISTTCSAFLLLFITTAFASAATLAAVDDETGHAILVSYRGNCYAILPDHVAAQDRISLISALPQIAGIGTVFLRKPDDDLALAYVEGDLAQNCGLRWEDLSRPVGPLLAQSSAGALNRINFGGQFLDRAEGNVYDADDTHFWVATTDRWADAEVMSGVSGAIFFKDNVPVGMALSAESNRSAKFLRMDRIHALFDAVLIGKSATHPANQPIASSALGLGYRVTSTVVDRDGKLEGVEGVLQWQWMGAPIEIELTLSNEVPVPIRKISIRANNRKDGMTTHPQRITVQVDSGMPGSAFWRPLGATDMSPIGVLDIKTGGSRARRVKLRIESVWQEGLPVQIDAITFE